MNKCPSCGSPLPKNSAFCPNCGSQLFEFYPAPPEEPSEKKKKRFLILFLLLFLLIAGFVFAFILLRNTSDNKLRRQLSLGDRYYEDLDYDRAIAAYDEALSIDPKNEDALIGIAHTYEDRGAERLQEDPGSEEGYSDLLTAMDYYKQAEEYHPDSDRLPEIQQGIQRCEEAAASYSGNPGGASEGPAGTTVTEQTGAEQTEEAKPVLEVGDTYTFGTYEQDNDTSNGAEEIEWIVLDKDDDKVLLISRYVLDCLPYNTTEEADIWEDCSLREWLNGSFLKTAFSADDSEQIVTSTVRPDGSADLGYETKDRVFLPGVSEIEAYFGSLEGRRCKPTKYAIAKGANTSATNDCCSWWLRSRGNFTNSAAFIDTDGFVFEDGIAVDVDHIGVRPVLWLTVTEQAEEEPAKEEQSALEVGSTYIFGTYEQDNDTSNGAEDIEWIVLDKDGDKLLLVSKYGLDSHQYHAKDTGVTWETCSLRTWMNGTFLETAFSADEAERIVTSTVSADKNPMYDTDSGNDTIDQVFLLSISEAETYFKSSEDMKCEPTEYAKARGAVSYVDNLCYWWMRTPGHISTYAAFYSTELYYYGASVTPSNFAVRPAIWIVP